MKNILSTLIAIFTISFAQGQDSKSQKEEVVCFYVDAEHIACMKLEESGDSKDGKANSSRKRESTTRKKSEKIVNGEITREQYEELYLRKLYSNRDSQGVGI